MVQTMAMAKNFKRTSFSAYMFALCLFLFSVSPSVEYDVDYSQPLPGSTEGLANIFIGRCFEYLKLYKHLQLHSDEADLETPATFCKGTWEIFRNAFAGKDICTVQHSAYEPYLARTGSTELNPITNKLLLWSGTFELSGKYADHGERAVALADTLTGYLVTDLNWCGDTTGKSKDGINYKECTRCKTSEESVALEGFEVFWGIASESFAKRAAGLVRHLVNGTRVGVDDAGKMIKIPAFTKDTFFYKHELPNLDPRKVKEILVMLANEPSSPFPAEQCGQGSMLELEKAIEEQGRLKKKPFRSVCKENPPEILRLLCVDAPADAKECALTPKPGSSQRPVFARTDLFKKYLRSKMQELKPVKE